MTLLTTQEIQLLADLYSVLWIRKKGGSYLPQGILFWRKHGRCATTEPHPDLDQVMATILYVAEITHDPPEY